MSLNASRLYLSYIIENSTRIRISIRSTAAIRSLRINTAVCVLPGMFKVNNRRSLLFCHNWRQNMYGVCAASSKAATMVQ